MVLLGSAFDLEDSEVTAEEMVWSVGDTVLGVGSAVNATLPVGTHVISLQVTDSAGSSATDDVEITVGP